MPPTSPLHLLHGATAKLCLFGGVDDALAGRQKPSGLRQLLWICPRTAQTAADDPSLLTHELAVLGHLSLDAVEPSLHPLLDHRTLGLGECTCHLKEQATHGVVVSMFC